MKPRIPSPVTAAREVWSRPPLTIPAPPPDRKLEALRPLPSAATATPWPLNENEIDLPQPLESARPERRGERHATDYLGYFEAVQRRVIGRLSIEVLFHPDTAQIEIGPYRLDREQATRLHHLLTLARGLLDTTNP